MQRWHALFPPEQLSIANLVKIVNKLGTKLWVIISILLFKKIFCLLLKALIRLGLIKQIPRPICQGSSAAMKLNNKPNNNVARVSDKNPVPFPQKTCKVYYKNKELALDVGMIGRQSRGCCSAGRTRMDDDFSMNGNRDIRAGI